MERLIALHSITKKYSATVALKGITLDFPETGMIFIKGESGSKKCPDKTNRRPSVSMISGLFYMIFKIFLNLAFCKRLPVFQCRNSCKISSPSMLSSIL